MAKLLYIEASPRKARSHSIAVAEAFLADYRQANPQDEIESWDLWSMDLPDLDEGAIAARYAIARGLAHTPEQAAAWQRITDFFARFAGADKYLISVPMWNFGVPYKLKHLVDVVTQPGLAFRFTPGEGYQGLVTGKPATVIHARGGAYGAGTGAEGFDFQKPYVENWLRFIGFTDVRSILVEPTLAQPETAANAREQALEEARAVAVGF
ncbi:MAG: FMN-dependent NADH-azoreductase [Pseudomonadota bacterium]